VRLVVDASVGLKWVLPEPDSHLAQVLVESGEALLIPDFWLNEACNVLWLQVRRAVFTPDEARSAFGLLRRQLPPIQTGDLGLHELALEIGLAVDQSTYDTLYVAFAIAMRADKVVAADGPFIRKMRSHPDLDLAGMMLTLDEWAAGRGPTA
jgi:predicted nucleic acid-binding protein